MSPPREANGIILKKEEDIGPEELELKAIMFPASEAQDSFPERKRNLKITEEQNDISMNEPPAKKDKTEKISKEEDIFDEPEEITRETVDILERTWPHYNAVSRSCCEVTVTKLSVDEHTVSLPDKWADFIADIKSATPGCRKRVSLDANWLLTAGNTKVYFMQLKGEQKNSLKFCLVNSSASHAS